MSTNIKVEDSYETAISELNYFSKASVQYYI